MWPRYAVIYKVRLYGREVGRSSYHVQILRAAIHALRKIRFLYFEMY